MDPGRPLLDPPPRTLAELRARLRQANLRRYLAERARKAADEAAHRATPLEEPSTCAH